MKCFYHKSDLDGHCSGAIVLSKYPECEMVGVDYKDKLEDFEITEGEVVFIVDFSFTREEMLYLEGKTLLRWLDHHKSAIEKCEGLEIAGIREIGKAGCELTWEFIYPEKIIPETVVWLGRYDVWDHSDTNTLNFQYGMRFEANTYPDSKIWDDVLSSSPLCIDILNTGETILEYERTQNEKYAQGMSYELNFEGYRAIVINKPYSNSKIFDSIYDPEKHDIMVIFGIKDGKYKYSLYCDKEVIDVSEIAVRFGGGGHAGASGFYHDELLV